MDRVRLLLIVIAQFINSWSYFWWQTPRSESMV